MAIGYDNNSNGGKGGYEPTVYSKFTLKNGESTVDKTSLSVQYMYGLLNVNIAPKVIDGNDNGYDRFDFKNKIEIWLSFRHAMMLHDEILRLIQINDPEKLRTVGVSAVNKGQDRLITFGFGNAYGVDGYVLVIYNLTPEGDVMNSYAYEFKGKEYASIVNFDPTTKNYEKNMMPDLEVKSFLMVLEEYAKASTGAYAYMDQYYSRFNNNHIYNSLGAISEKLGVVAPRSNRGGGRSSGGFFDNSQSNESSTSISGNEFRNTTLDGMGEDMYE